MLCRARPSSFHITASVGLVHGGPGLTAVYVCFHLQASPQNLHGVIELGTVANTKMKLVNGITAIAVSIALLSATVYTSKASDTYSTKSGSLMAAVNSYENYIGQYQNIKTNNQTVSIDVARFRSSEKVAVQNGFEGKQGSSILTSGTGFVEWTVQIPKAGLYAIKIEYVPIKGTEGYIQRSILIDGQEPFEEAGNIQFSRAFKDATTVVHSKGQNDKRPAQQEVFEWSSVYVQDTQRFYGDKLEFYFSAGSHRIQLKSLAEPMAIHAVTLESKEKQTKTYSEVLSQYKDEGLATVRGVLKNGIEVKQAEDSYEKSDQTLYPVSDNTSPNNEPFDISKQKINAIGGTKWENPGQWIEWKISVPASGLYEIGYRCKQNYVRDINSERSIYIDGQLPFKEASDLSFSYNNKWTVSLAGGDTPYLFYLSKGTHTIKMQVTLGDLANSLMLASNSLKTLNQANWDLLTILGNSPDLNRDYNLDEYCPQVIQVFRKQAEQLQTIADEWVAMTGKQDSNVAQIDQLIYELTEMSKDPDTIPGLYLTFRDNLSNFANIIVNAEKQPLMLDYLFIAEKGAKLPSANVTFFSSIKFGILKFLMSFVTDYNNLSDDSAARTKKAITVWIGNGLTGGRDQAVSLNDLILQDFTSKYKIPVTLEIIPPSTILTATVSGKGPDVALQVNGSDPANYAMRHAVVDLSKLSGFSEVEKRFNKNTLTPYTYLGGIYALPETFSFPVMFYRKDILSQLGIDINQIRTWDDLIAVLPIFQRKNMNIGIPANYTSYYIFLYQLGGTLYKNQDTASNLDSKTALTAFDYWMNFYTNYNLPMAYTFVQRFRTGEMPVAIDDYTQYNTIKLAAPEIEGEWGMTTIPGMKKSDGTINNTAPITGAGCILMSASKNKASAWEFMRWYTGSDAQYDFGSELESVMGVGARYNTANLDAFDRLPWTVDEKASLTKQISHLVGIPEVPGGYLTSRDIGFAMNTTYNDNADARKMLLSYVDQINQEIKLKREEFGLEK